MNTITAYILGGIMTLGSWLGLVQPEAPVNFGAFSDPFLSIQLATDPDNGECLTTDGTNNAWSSSCGGGGGSSDHTYPFVPNTAWGGQSTSTLTGFTGGLFSTASSTFTGLLKFINATGTQATLTDLFISGDQISDFAGTGLSVTTGALNVDFTEFDSDSITEGSTNLFSEKIWTLASNLISNQGANSNLELDGFLVGSTAFNDTGNTIHDKRFYFDKINGAFRAGIAQSTQWDTRGIYSSAFGTNNIASGQSSSAFGSTNTVSGQNATAFGNQNTASQTNATAFGSQTTASGVDSTTFGANTTASGNYTTAFGQGLTVSGSHGFGIALNDQTGITVSQANTFAVLGGKVGIGTTTPTNNFEVVGGSFLSGTTTANALKLNITGTGIEFSDGTILTTSSNLALSDGEVFTGNHDFGGATFLEIPNGTAPTADDPGEIAHDTTDNQLILDDYVVGRATTRIWGVTVASTSPAFIDAGLLKVPTNLDGYTMTAIRCSVQGGTSKVIAVEDESTNSTEDITCATTVTSDDGSITNATVTAGEEMYIDFGATTGVVDYVSISVFGQWTRE